MASRALDLVGVFQALATLEDELIGSRTWHTTGELAQDWFVQWYQADAWRQHVWTDRAAKASPEHDVLNFFLEDHGIADQFGSFPGLGVATIADIRPRWPVPGIPTVVRNNRGAFQAFALTPPVVSFYTVPGLASPVAQIKTDQGLQLWLATLPEPPGFGINLVEDVAHILEPALPERAERAGVVVPSLNMARPADMSWLLGLNAQVPAFGRYPITEAYQLFMLRMSEEGRTDGPDLFPSHGKQLGWEPLVFDYPFVGIFTAVDSTVPLAAFYADIDSWITHS